MGYVKVHYRGQVFGPMRSQMTLTELLTLLRVPCHDNVVLIAVKDNATVVQVDSPLADGCYELLEGPHRARTPLMPCPLSTPKVSQETTRQLLEDLDISIHAMMHVIGSIPPRYYKYNAQLRCKADNALVEVARLQTIAEKSNARPYGEIAFVKYRIIQLLHAVWESVWARRSPRIRYVDIYTDVVDDMQRCVASAEYGLNRALNWKHCLTKSGWSQICKSSTFEHVTRISKLYRSPGQTVPSLKLFDAYPRAWYSVLEQ